jgi:hypothetical protein
MRKNADTERELNGLFKEAISFRGTLEFKEMMDFIARRSKIAPYNSYLVFIQRPGISFAASRLDWAAEGRRVRPKARPLIILRPFGPVDLVYDLDDTEGDSEFDLSRLDYWKSSGVLDEEEAFRVIENMESIGLYAIPYDGELSRRRFAQPIPFGIAQAKGSDTRTVSLRPGAESAPLEDFFGTLIHEYAHHLLGHLGAWFITLPQKRPFAICERDRSSLAQSEKEWEAESVAFIVCRRLGLEYGALEYLAQYATDGDWMPRIDICSILTAANKLLKGIMVRNQEMNAGEDENEQLGLFDEAW